MDSALLWIWGKIIELQRWTIGQGRRNPRKENRRRVESSVRTGGDVAVSDQLQAVSETVPAIDTHCFARS
jgi:hypothetical protein